MGRGSNVRSTMDLYICLFNVYILECFQLFFQRNIKSERKMVEDSYQWPSTSDAMVSNPGMSSINTRELRFPEKYNAFLSIEDKNQYIQNFNADYYHESRYLTQDQPIQRQVQNQVNQHAQNKLLQNHQRQQVQHQEVQNQGEASHKSSPFPKQAPPHSHSLQEDTREVQESVVGIFFNYQSSFIIFNTKECCAK